MIIYIILGASALRLVSSSSNKREIKILENLRGGTNVISLHGVVKVELAG